MLLQDTLMLVNPGPETVGCSQPFVTKKDTAPALPGGPSPSWWPQPPACLTEPGVWGPREASYPEMLRPGNREEADQGQVGESLHLILAGET